MAAAKFRVAFEDLNQRLARNAYVLGDEMTGLDIAWYVYALRLRRCVYPMSTLRPRVSAWLNKLHAQDSFRSQTTMLPAMAETSAQSQRLQASKERALAQLMGVAA